jgi:hypothetical protein
MPAHDPSFTRASLWQIPQGLDLDPDLPLGRFRDLTFHDLELPTGR